MPLFNIDWFFYGEVHVVADTEEDARHQAQEIAAKQLADPAHIEMVDFETWPTIDDHDSSAAAG
jgi:hypothetical protein